MVFAASLRSPARTPSRKTTREVTVIGKEVCHGRFRSGHPFPETAAVGVEGRGSLRVSDAVRVPSAVVEEVKAAAASPVVRGAVVGTPANGKLQGVKGSLFDSGTLERRK